jgi:hypothetical protein
MYTLFIRLKIHGLILKIIENETVIWFRRISVKVCNLRFAALG